MHSTHNGSAQNGSSAQSHVRTQKNARGNEPKNGQPPVTSIAATPPCLCEACQKKVLDWLRQYEREIETQAQSKRGRNNFLHLALAKHVIQHLRQLRRMLVKQPQSIVELAKEMFEATEVKTSGANGSQAEHSDVQQPEVNGSCD